jgi:hypothetical protein
MRHENLWDRNGLVSHNVTPETHKNYYSVKKVKCRKS